MRCPECDSPENGVKDSRPTDDGATRRRRVCGDCGALWTTWESDQMPRRRKPKPWHRLTDEQRTMISTLIYALDRQNRQPERTEKERERRCTRNRSPLSTSLS